MERGSHFVFKILLKEAGKNLIRNYNYKNNKRQQLFVLLLPLSF